MPRIRDGGRGRRYQTRARRNSSSSSSNHSTSSSNSNASSRRTKRRKDKTFFQDGKYKLDGASSDPGNSTERSELESEDSSSLDAYSDEPSRPRHMSRREREADTHFENAAQNVSVEETSATGRTGRRVHPTDAEGETDRRRNTVGVVNRSRFQRVTLAAEVDLLESLRWEVRPSEADKRASRKREIKWAKRGAKVLAAAFAALTVWIIIGSAVVMPAAVALIGTIAIGVALAAGSAGVLSSGVSALVVDPIRRWRRGITDDDFVADLGEEYGDEAAIRRLAQAFDALQDLHDGHRGLLRRSGMRAEAWAEADQERVQAEKHLQWCIFTLPEALRRDIQPSLPPRIQEALERADELGGMEFRVPLAGDLQTHVAVDRAASTHRVFEEAKTERRRTWRVFAMVGTFGAAMATFGLAIMGVIAIPYLAIPALAGIALIGAGVVLGGLTFLGISVRTMFGAWQKGRRDRKRLEVALERCADAQRDWEQAVKAFNEATSSREKDRLDDARSLADAHLRITLDAWRQARIRARRHNSR